MTDAKLLDDLRPPNELHRFLLFSRKKIEQHFYKKKEHRDRIRDARRQRGNASINRILQTLQENSTENSAKTSFKKGDKTSDTTTDEPITGPLIISIQHFFSFILGQTKY